MLLFRSTNVLFDQCSFDESVVSPWDNLWTLYERIPKHPKIYNGLHFIYCNSEFVNKNWQETGALVLHELLRHRVIQLGITSKEVVKEISDWNSAKELF